MDSNGTRFLLLNSAADFRESAGDCGWDATRRAFTLRRRDLPRLSRLPAADALTALAVSGPLVRDSHGQLGRLSADGSRFEFALTWPAPDTAWRPVRVSAAGEVAPDAESLILDAVDPPPGTRFVDLHLGGEGLAALAWTDGAARHGLTVVHLRARWQTLCDLDLAPRRVWVDDRSRVWVAGEDALALCRGAPLPQPYVPRPDRFEPTPVNPDPPRQVWRQALPGHQGLLGMAADREWLYLLVRVHDELDGTPRQMLLRRALDERPDAAIDPYALPAELPFATDLAAVEPGAVALFLPPDPDAIDEGRLDCPVVEPVTLPETGELVARLRLERWPRHSWGRALFAPAGDPTIPHARFVRAADGLTRYLAADRPRELHRLAQARYPEVGRAVLLERLDSGEPDTLWHRLTLDGCIPPGCALQVDARVSDDWARRAESGWDPQSAPLWLPQASELPYYASGLAPEPGRQGLFEVLLQRPNGAVRELRGRYLELRLTLAGDGRHTPAVHAIRAWFPRFSWQQAYLPEHFHQQERPPAVTPDPSVATEAANAADLRQRLLAALEGMLTPVEDRIAAAEVLLDPDGVPAAHLPRLAATLGGKPPAHWPEARQRRWTGSLGALQRTRGTLGGLRLALDIATDGAVGRGQVVPVETFRLRRTLATVLGISMDDANHPLTLGTGQSGNSIVGESLILTDEDSREFLALFAPELAETEADRQTVSSFFDRYARGVTVVLHGAARALRRTVAAVLGEQVPAAVQWVIRETDHPFVLGLAPLLDIETFLETQPPFGRVVLDRTRLGRGDLLRNPTALSPEHARPEYGIGEQP